MGVRYAISFVCSFVHSFIHLTIYIIHSGPANCTCAGGEVWDVAEFERVGVREKFYHSAEP